jgi:hypothetical protein
MIEFAAQGKYRQLAEEIGKVLQAAAETADKMQEDARLDAARIRAEAETELRTACAEGRRILDEARMEADVLRGEAEWQSQEIIAQARRQAAERLAAADARLAEMEKAENRVLDRLAGVGQVLTDALATLREGTTEATPAAIDPADDADSPTAKVYFVEFPPADAAAPAEAADPAGTPIAASSDADAGADPAAEQEVVLTENPAASLFHTDEERSEWAPPGELPAWWTRGGAQG